MDSCGLFCALKYGSQFFWLYRKVKRGMLNAKRKITIKSGREEIQMEVTEEAYQKFYRPWWQQKKKEQRNREAMEAQGYRTESYEEWKENDMRTELFQRAWRK